MNASNQNKNNVNTSKANAFYVGVYCDPHIVVILHIRIFTFILWERTQNSASPNIKKIISRR